MPAASVLVVDDEPDIVELVSYNLRKEGFGVETAASAEEAFAKLEGAVPDLLVLDIMLPGIDGVELCRRIRQDKRLRLLPIIMLTARAEETDIVHGLDAGADDYVPKPFSIDVFLSRVRALLRRQQKAPVGENARVRMKEITLDPERFEAFVGEMELRLTLTEFRLLHFLARNPGRVFTRYQIVDAVKGEDYPVTDRSVDVQVVGLRRKLGKCGSYIETVRGVGYRFADE